MLLMHLNSPQLAHKQTVTLLGLTLCHKMDIFPGSSSHVARPAATLQYQIANANRLCSAPSTTCNNVNPKNNILSEVKIDRKIPYHLQRGQCCI